MKKIFLILTFLIAFSPSMCLMAQTEKELLIELIKQQAVTNAKVDKLAEQQAELTKQVAKLTEQVIEIAKQQAVTNAEIKGLDRRLETNTTFVIAILTGLIALMGVILWDRKTVTKPFEEKTEKIEAEIALLKEKELKLEERELRHEEKMEAYFKKIAQIDARFAEIF